MGERKHCPKPVVLSPNAQLPNAPLIKRRMQCDSRRPWRQRRTSLCDDLDPRQEACRSDAPMAIAGAVAHVESVFGVSLWHSGDS